MLLSRVLSAVVIALGLLTAPALGRFLEGDELRVVNVKDNDVLNIREYPTEQAKIIGFIPPGSDGVMYLGKSQNPWILVRFNGTEGWVNRNFLRLSARRDYGRWDKILEPRYTRQLPPGYFDLTPVLPEMRGQRISGDEAVLCRHWRNAISYGKRIALGYSPREAIEDITDARDGERVCRYIHGLLLTPLRIALRGDDADHKIWIVEWMDQHGKTHYTGSPKED
jgi:hypothetical protein